MIKSPGDLITLPTLYVSHISWYCQWYLHSRRALDRQNGFHGPFWSLGGLGAPFLTILVIKSQHRGIILLFRHFLMLLFVEECDGTLKKYLALQMGTSLGFER